MYPILFSTPWFNVYSYGLLIALGYTLGTVLILREARRDGLDANAIFDMLLLQLIVGICGSRLLFVLEYTPEKLNFRLLRIRTGRPHFLWRRYQQYHL